jgi:hypothetical protein
MIEEINQVILSEKEIIKDIREHGQSYELLSQLLGLNNELQDLITKEDNSITSKTNIQSRNTKLSEMKYVDKKDEVEISFLQNKSLANIANKMFGKKTEKMVPKMQQMNEDLQKANSGVLLQTFLSITMFITLISFIAGGVIYAALYFLKIIPINYIWIVFLLPVVCFFLFYSYPKSEASNIDKKITNELPFVTIHMAAIASSDMEPTQIFQIIAMSDEYKAVGKELKKVLTQVNVYGYDLLTSLTNAAKTVSNKRLSELLLGMATNISTGGSLKVYLEKKAETYLMDYKLSRKQYIEIAGTFMDIYISVLIAAPLIMMLLFIIMNVADMSIAGMSLKMLLFLTVGIVAIMNIIFIFVLNMKQPAV